METLLLVLCCHTEVWHPVACDRDGDRAEVLCLRSRRFSHIASPLRHLLVHEQLAMLYRALRLSEEMSGMPKLDRPHWLKVRLGVGIDPLLHAICTVLTSPWQ